MALAARTFRVFVSSTFEDLVEERDLLQRKVFPLLTEFCQARGAHFQAIDLRWGVSEQESVDNRAIGICLAEIDRCKLVSPRPNFVVLLGDRYGWCPPPSEIPADAFDRITARVRSVGDLELLHDWYGLDDNAVPPACYLRPRQGAMRAHDVWEPVERRLRAILEEAVAGTEWAHDPQFVGSATEQEIVAGALAVPHADEHVFCFMRSIVTEDGAAGSAGPADQRIALLKAKLRAALPHGVFEYQTSRYDRTHLDQLEDDVLAALTRVISAELDLLEQEDPISRESARHREFGAERARDFTGRGWDLARIAQYVERDGDGWPAHPLVVHGASGAGKSALIARAAIDAQQDHPNAVTVTRFLGCTPESTNGRDLLDGLCRQIVRAYSSAPELVAEDLRERLDERTLPTSYDDLVRDFEIRIGLARAERPLHIFLDALDQLPATDPVHRLDWLPSALPEHVRIVVSTMALATAHRILESRLAPGQLTALDRMEQADGDRLLGMWLARAGRTLTPAQQALVIERFELEGLPLYLKLAFEQARWWRSDEQVQLAIGIRGVIRTNLLARLAAEEAHGAMLVGHSLGYLAAARNGLSEDELLDLVSADGEVLADFRRRSPRSPAVDRLPPIVWSRLYFDLEPYLAERAADGGRLLTFYHRQLREVIEEDYLAGEDGVRRHRHLAAYFGDDDRQPLRRADGANLRRLSELPFQQTEARLWEALTATLTDFLFLTSKAQHAGVVEIGDGDLSSEVVHLGVYQLQADYALALSRLPESGGVLESFCDALEREAHNLVAEPELLFQQLYNRLQWLTGPARDVAERERARRQTVFMHTLTRARESTALRRILTADRSSVRDVAAIPGSGLIVSAGEDAELKIWDPWTGELISLLVGHTGSVETCEPTPDGSRLVSLSRDETLRIWDLATGATVHTLPAHYDPSFSAFNYSGADFGCAISSDGHFAVVPNKGSRGAFTVWDIDDGVLISSFDGHRRSCSSWALGPDSSVVAAGYSDGRLLTWNPLDGRLIATTVVFGDEVQRVAFSSDGALLFSRTWRMSVPTLVYGGGAVEPSRLEYWVECWDSRTLERLWSREGDSFAVGTDGTVFVGCGEAVDVLNQRGEVVSSFSGRPGRLSPDGKVLVSSGEDVSSLTVWDLSTGRRVGDLIGHDGGISNWVFTGTGLIATACDEGTVGIWDLSKLSPGEDLPGHVGPVGATRFSPDGAMVVSAGHTNALESASVKLWSAADGSLLRAVDAHSGEWAYGALLSDRNDLVTCGLNDVAFWRGDGRLAGRWHGQVSLSAVSDDGEWVLGCGWSAGLMILDPARAALITTVPTESQVLRTALTPDGHRVFGACRDGAVHTWNVADWSSQAFVAAPTDGNGHGRDRPITAVAVSPDSRHGLSAHIDGWIVIWELATGAEVRVLDHPVPVWGCTYTPNGAAIVSTTADGTIWVWDAHGRAPGRLLARARAPSAVCAITPDGRFVITSPDTENSMTVRELATGTVVASIRMPGASTCFDLHPWRPILTCGDQAGNVSLIEIVGLEYGAIVVTARQRPGPADLFVRCPCCRLEHDVDPAELGGEQRCPTAGCDLPLRLNSFFASSTPATPAGA